ncbi:NAC domain-containing protein 21/22-like isoform X2 [Corylus avellana]|uniref:NAC domain-containing protein 21/22-like isoform X2 n=1 Tax=Corylus avellana TaxID=13451 RepID=UPI001E202B4F|nr:NAC domain-containing protein 21/22-like isoform X2 [Corylus avellana]
MGLRDIGAALPPGFRFYPSDEELVCHYLYKKITNEEVLKGTLMEIDLHTCEPWQLPEVAKLNASEWYFFSFRDRKYATGFRTNRATISGYWKATGKDRTVVDPVTREVVGMRKTLVFYRNRAPNGIKTGWIMHEFRLETPHMPPKEDWVLCRVFHKSKGMMPNSENSCTFESTTACASSPPSSQIMPCGYNQMMITSFASTPSHHQNQNQSQSQSQNNSLLNLLQFSQDITSTNNQISSKGDDEYGFLWDMSLEENSLETVAPAPNMEEMRFEIDNNMVFL